MPLEPARLQKRLYEILNEKFGFTSFRPYQEEVCVAAASGKDVLLVMPTGAGKSLCYQLPGLARQDTTLVISPLLALIEDQVGKLRELGFNAERIHSGRDRESLREACSQYLRGDLDFLFIAPERLAVPGFIEMLAKRKPALIAVDEAHCISQWGHDFRPEYRMLGQRLPALRPAPIIALTATATPRVQDDIVGQLGIPNAERFIRGFRRTNIAIETVELNPSERIDLAQELLSSASRRPAILYAPTRKRAEEVAVSLAEAGFKAQAYHAGLSAPQRERIQRSFLQGDNDVIVATIAFGMGIDKADIRTVVHLALPASVEGYYQEIGRAGRDGRNSRAILMHAYIDRRTHEFFYERDYPETSVLRKVFEATGPQPLSMDELREKASVDDDFFEKALEKLWIHGGVQIDSEQNVTRAQANWDRPYSSHRTHREAQLEHMTQLAQSQSCRMLQLVRYFGDTSDTGAECGLCDICDSSSAALRREVAMTDDEDEAAAKILRALATQESPSTGKLHRDLFDERSLERRKFERILSGLARAKLINVFEDSFLKDGRTIAFRRANLTLEGARLVRRELIGLSEMVMLTPEPIAKKNSARAAKKKVPATNDVASAELIASLKAWRINQARSQRLPAFRVLSDRVLIGIAQALPRSESDLLGISGIGPKLAEKYGPQIIAVIEAHGAAPLPEK